MMEEAMSKDVARELIDKVDETMHPLENFVEVLHQGDQHVQIAVIFESLTKNATNGLYEIINDLITADQL